MTTDKPTSRTRRTDRWTPARLFRGSFALTFGLLTALIVVVGLLYLLFGPGGGETLVLEEEDVIIEDVTDEQSAPVLEPAMDDCPADACILPMPRRPRVA